MNVQLKKCHDRPDCKSDEEILKFFRNKFLLLFYNRVRFDQRYYGAESITFETRFHWLRINTQMQQTIPF